MAYGDGYTINKNEQSKIQKMGSGGASGGAPKNSAENIPPTEDNKFTNYVLDCIGVGETYRDSFKPGWDTIESQIACEKPTEWSSKQPWQSKVFIGVQSKTSETILARTKKLLFPQQFFSMTGVEESDKNLVNNVIKLLVTIFRNGGFYEQNDFVVQEAGDFGTSALKLWVNDTKDGINFEWVSCMKWLIDPDARADITKAKWWVCEYKKDIGDLIAESQKKNGLYTKEAIQKILDRATGQAAGKEDNDLATIRGIDGTSSIQIPKAMKQIIIHEFWGKVKSPIKKKVNETDWVDTNEYTYEDRVITVADKAIEIRNDLNPYGFIPVVFMRTKRRKYDFYGRGYILNTVGLQELMNSIVNLGFDSLKINSMDIIKLNVNAVDDANSIEYKPLAIWKLRDVNGAEITRGQGMSALTDVLNGVRYIDTMHQDVSGITRAVAGSPALGGGQDTLGEYQSKLQQIEERFLGQLSPIENEYIIPLVRKVYDIIRNKDLFSQKAIDEIVGTEILPPMTMPGTGVPVAGSEKEIPILDQKELADRPFTRNFNAVGVNQVSQNADNFARLQKLMMLVMQDPNLRVRVKDEKLLKAIMDSLQIPDSEDMIRKDSEMSMAPPPPLPPGGQGSGQLGGIREGGQGYAV